MSKVYLEDSVLTDIADAIREKTGESGTITPANMPTEIEGISGGGVIESKTITANGTYTAPEGVDGYSPIVVEVGEPINLLNMPVTISQQTTGGVNQVFLNGLLGINNVHININITNPSHYENYVSNVLAGLISPDSNQQIFNAIIPFDYIHITPYQDDSICYSLQGFYNGVIANNQYKSPKIIIPAGKKLWVGIQQFLYYTEYKDSTTFPEEWSQFELKPPTKHFSGVMFQAMQTNQAMAYNSRLREQPNFTKKYIFDENEDYTMITNSIYNTIFSNDYSLDEIYVPAFPFTNTTTSRCFNTGSFSELRHCHSIKFQTYDNGNPLEWGFTANQTIDLTGSVGYGNIQDYGFSADKKITNDTTYEALKNDPDAWTTDINYSLYNHDSAVETINTLPKLVNTLTGSCVIKFKGNSGSATDAGAINTLTSAEIAVASDKGWTVTLS